MSRKLEIPTNDLRILHIYRRVPYLMTVSNREVWESRWSRICRETGDHISRIAYADEVGEANAVEQTFDAIARLVDQGYLDGSMPSWSLYRLTEQGAALLDRWKRAGFPR